MDKKPKWQKEIESFKGIKSTFIIENNINDIYPHYMENGKANYFDLDSILIKLFKIEEKKDENNENKLEYDFVFCNPVLGFYNKRTTNVANILKEFDKSNNSIFKDDKKQNYKIDDIEKFSVIIKEAMTQKKDNPIAVVINFAARYISSPTSLDSCENNTFINLFEASMNANKEDGYSNTLILIVEKFNDLPSWFY